MSEFRNNQRSSGNSYRSPQQGGASPSGGNGEASPEFRALLEKVNLKAPTVDMFDGVAMKIADELASNHGKGGNKSSQVRNFYDEIIRYDDRHRDTGRPDEDKARFERDLPFIRMICARAAYARTRGHVDANFVGFLQDGLRKIERAEDLHMFRSLFQAVIGFSPKSQGG
jgi:CRISPR-associated protein Csm2